MVSKKLMTVAMLGFSALSTAAYAEEFTLTSNVISEGEKLSLDHVYNGFGCKGKNIAPDLSWSNVPEGTESFAITVYDPDAPTGSGWWHWFAFNIPTQTTTIAKGGELPEGATVLKNDYGKHEFGGACPPVGEVHRYQFTIYALDTMLEIDDSVSNALAGYMVNVHAIASDSITAVYHR